MVVLTVFALSTIGCSEEEKYNTDYQWLALSQATEQWNGSACNKLITLQENQVTDTIIKLTVSLYQNQTASQDCTADVVVAKDSLSKAIALSEKGGIYDVYRNALLMSDEYFGAYIWLNLAVGANGGDPSETEFPMKYYVDYVRVYQLDK